MISAMPAVAVRRERKKQQAKRAAAASRANSLSSLGTNSTRSTSLSNNSSTCHSAPSTPHAASTTTFLPYHPYYNYYSSRRGLNHQSPAPSLANSLNHPPDTPHNNISPNNIHPSIHGGSGGGGAKRSSSNPSVSTITSAATSYVSALHRVRERQLDAQRERARFVLYTGSVLITAGLALVFIGLAITLSSAQTIGLLFIGLGSIFCLARYFCLGVDQIPMVKHARTVSGQSIYNCGLQPSAATTPGTDDSQSSASSYYFSALPLHRMHLPLSPHNNSVSHDVVSASSIMTTPTSSGAAGAVQLQSSHHQQQPPQPPFQPPPPAGGPHGGSSGGGGGLHRDRHSIHSNASSLLTPMSLNSIPEMQVLITDDSQRY